CTNGLLVGETLGVMLMVPLLALVDGSWRWSFAVLGIPPLVNAMLTAVIAPKPEPTGAASAPPASLKWRPDWSNKLIWQLGILFGSVNIAYFATNAFLPGPLAGAGRSDLIIAALTALNFGQLPASFVMLAVA